MKYPNPHWCCLLHTLPFIASGNVKETGLKSKLQSIATGSKWIGLILFSNLTQHPLFFLSRKWNPLLAEVYFLFLNIFHFRWFMVFLNELNWILKIIFLWWSTNFYAYEAMYLNRNLTSFETTTLMWILISGIG